MDGFRIGKRGSFLEEVHFDKNEIKLLSRGDGVEVLLQTIEKDRLFYVYPSDNPNVMEFFYILSGHLVCELDDQKIELGPQDYYTAKGLKGPVHFTALTDITYLWVITEPTFRHLSKDISKLMNIVKEVEKKDRYTYMHSDRVAEYAVKIAKKLKLNKEQLENLSIASVLHDIGKIHIPEEILNKPGRLTPEEFELIKKHPADGAEMIKETYYGEIAPIIEQHHERLDGSGYPHGLHGSGILLEARIIAVSDTFDAMTEDRAYRKASDVQTAMSEIRRLSGTHYDETVVDAFEEVLREEGRI
ncbi:HD domain-containing phosphohydrolase [Paenibacillus tuaregi]|uniref:HD domain-containing phosphohydrolase n=1 Tax=Paenibacillus tuaregi TaxID=1816681 RepID=UPI0008397CA5|nr:HD domain-containing phosphohydrolase [Paenibacillus tuaregi]